MALYAKSLELEELAKETMKEFGDLAFLDDPEIRIAYQYSDQGKKSKNKTVFADTEVVKEKLKEFCRYDFIITFYRPNCGDLDKEHLMRVMYHELKHVGYDGEDHYFIVPHDLEDFRDCVNKWGPDWVFTA